MAGCSGRVPSGLCRSIPTTSPTFWQPHSGQVALLLPFPDPTFAGTWQYGQPREPESASGVQPHSSASQSSPQLGQPHPHPRAPHSAQAPVPHVAAAGEGKFPGEPQLPPAMVERCLQKGSPRTPLGPLRLG